MRELHAEEADWTDFSRDEAQVKDALANNLMQALINDTVDALKKAYALWSITNSANWLFYK